MEKPCAFTQGRGIVDCLSAAAASTVVVAATASTAAAIVAESSVATAGEEKDKNNDPPAAVVVSEHEISPRKKKLYIGFGSFPFFAGMLYDMKTFRRWLL